MKILMYASIYPPAIGGPSTQVFSLCQSLKKHGEGVAVVTIGEKFGVENTDGYPVYRYPWKYTNTPIDKAIRWVIFPFYFWHILNKEKPDVVHAHSASVLSFLVGFILKIRGIPSVIKFAGDWVWETISTGGVKAKDFSDLRKKSAYARFLWKIEKLGLSFYDFIWAPSEFRARNVVDVQGHRKNVVVIYNALDLPDGGYHEVSTSDPFIVVAANRFIPHKRIPKLVEAFSNLGDNSKLVLVGTGQKGEIEAAKKVVEDKKITDKVTFTGRIEIEEVYEHFRAGSIYVSNSLEEGFPNVFVEAMHFGLPVVSTDVGGCNEIVKDGENGFLFDPQDQDALVKKMKELKTNLDLRNKMAKAAYDTSKRFELSHVLDEFLGLYKKALSR